MTLQAFWDELDRHDWFSTFSDDHSVYRCGEDDYERLLGLAKDNADREALLNGYRDHMFSGNAWNTPKQPKPERPA